MREGKITDQIYGRSIHKKLNSFRKEVLYGAAGDDCAFFSLEDGGPEAAVFVRQQVYGAARCGKYAVCGAVNRAAAAGSPPAALMLSLLLPADAQEPLLRAIVEEACGEAERLGVQIAEVSTSVTAAVAWPVMTAMAIGKRPAGGKKGSEAGLAAGSPPVRAAGGKAPAAAGMDVVMTKWAGLEGSAILAEACRTELLTRYPSYLVEEAAALDRFLSIVPEAAVAVKSNICAACAAGEGGIFGALWALAQEAGVGLEIMLKKIPIRQETVEICNFLDLNPYELAANGSLLAIAPQGEALVMALARAGVEAAVIGTVTANNDRIVINGEERRFLEPAKADEIFKWMEKRER